MKNFLPNKKELSNQTLLNSLKLSHHHTISSQYINHFLSTAFILILIFFLQSKKCSYYKQYSGNEWRKNFSNRSGFWQSIRMVSIRLTVNVSMFISSVLLFIKIDFLLIFKGFIKNRSCDILR